MSVSKQDRYYSEAEEQAKFEEMRDELRDDAIYALAKTFVRFCRDDYEQSTDWTYETFCDLLAGVDVLNAAKEKAEKLWKADQAERRSRRLAAEAMAS